MKLADVSSGADWIIWVVFAIFFGDFHNVTFWSWKLVYFWV